MEALDVLAAFAGYAQAQNSDDAANRPPKLATIDPAYTSGSPRVTFDGESTLSTKLYPYLDSYTPAPGDRVLLMPIGTGYVIVGAISTGQASGLPAGAIQAYAGTATPAGWLACDGSAVSRTTYSRLFAAIGTAWGTGNGTTTFGLPDMRGRVPVGVGAGSGLTSRALASSGGAETHTLTTDEMPSHNHGSDGEHTHSQLGASVVAEVLLSGGGSWALVQDGDGTTGSAGTHSHSSTGGDTAHENMPPYRGVAYIIKH